MTPQHTAQYGQFERVSIVFEVFRVRAWATRGWTSSPSATAPAPVIEHIKSLRETCILLPLKPFRECEGRLYATPAPFELGGGVHHWPFIRRFISRALARTGQPRSV